MKSFKVILSLATTLALFSGANASADWGLPDVHIDPPRFDPPRVPTPSEVVNAGKKAVESAAPVIVGGAVAGTAGAAAAAANPKAAEKAVNNVTNEVSKGAGNVAKEAGKGVGNVATEVGKGVGNVVTNVGKAGHDIIAEAGRVYDHNTQTFAIIGRAYACAASVCYSEVYYAQQLKKEREDADAQIEGFKNKELKAYKEGKTNEFYSAMRQEYVFLANNKKNIEESMTLATGLSNLSTEVSSALAAEIQLRKDMAVIGEKAPAAQGVTLDAVNEFKKAASKGQVTETDATKLGESLAALSKSKGLKIGELAAEALRNMDDQTLVSFVKFEATQKSSAGSYIRDLQRQLDAANARMKVIESKFAQAGQVLV